MSNPLSQESPSRLQADTKRATRITLWGQLGGQLISFAVLATLFRLVDPSEFGLFGMFMPVVLFVRSFSSLGLDIAAIQQRELTPRHNNAIFWYQIAVGLALSILLALLAPLLAQWYSTARLMPVGIALSLTALLHNSLTLHRTLAERKLNFGRLTLVRLTAWLFSGCVAILVAWNNLGVWALVAQQLSELLVLNVGYWVVEPWRPGWPAATGEIRSMLHVGVYYTLSGVLFALAQNMDKFLLGAWIGDSELGRQWIGYYTQAYNLMMRPVYLFTTPIGSAMLPALSQANRQREWMQPMAIDFFRMVGVVLWPGAVGLTLVGPQLMQVLGGPDWADAGALLGVMAVMIAAQGWINLCGPLLASVGRTDFLAWGALANLLALVVGSMIAAGVSTPRPEDLTKHMAWAVILATVSLVVPYAWSCFRIAGMKFSQLVSESVPMFAATLGMGCVVWLAGLTGVWLPDLAVLAVQIGSGIVSFAILARQDSIWLLRRLGGV